jgi:endonuclease/exonuclease/phosphatase family metal-dependent hydrolase
MKNLFTLMTYNVHRAVGTDRRQDYQRIVEVIREINPDIVTLQEIDSEADQSTARHSFLFETINGNIEHIGIKGITMLRSSSAYGNAIFFRNHPDEVYRHDISFGSQEPRGVMECVLQICDIPSRILTTHLGLKKQERNAQVRILKQLLDKDNNHPTLISGDFNEWYPFSQNLQKLREDMNMVPYKRSFPSQFPLFALDRIFYKGKIGLIDTYIHKSPLSRLASDHLPLVAKFFHR